MITFLRRHFFAFDLFMLGFLGLLLVLEISAFPAEHSTFMLSYLLGAIGCYLFFQRQAIKITKQEKKGVLISKRSSLVLLTYFLLPLPLIPITFLQLGKVLQDIDRVPSVEEHENFIPQVHDLDPKLRYDPDHAKDKGLQLGTYGAASYFDHSLKAFDQMLFGDYPPQWAKRFHKPWLSGIMQLAYVFYYLAPLLATLPLIMNRRWKDLRLAVTIIAGCLLFTYVIYLLVPATGPRFQGGIAAWIPEEPGWFGAEKLYHMIDQAETFRWNAFPSGHVAVSLCSLFVAWRFYPKIALLMALPVLLLCLSTLYMGYHYAIDVIAGILSALLIAFAIPPFVRFWEQEFVK